MPLYFHDLPRAEEGAYLVSRPADLADRLAERGQAFIMDRSVPAPTTRVLAFVVHGPHRVDRYGLMIRADLLDGSPEFNADSIRRTTPDGWELSVREAMI